MKELIVLTENGIVFWIMDLENNVFRLEILPGYL